MPQATPAMPSGNAGAKIVKITVVTFVESLPHLQSSHRPALTTSTTKRIRTGPRCMRGSDRREATSFELRRMFKGNIRPMKALHSRMRIQVRFPDFTTSKTATQITTANRRTSRISAASCGNVTRYFRRTPDWRLGKSDNTFTKQRQANIQDQRRQLRQRD